MKSPSSIREELLRSLFRSLIILYAIGSIVIYLIVQEAIERRTNELLRSKLKDFAEDTRVPPDDSPGREHEMGNVFHDFFDSELGQLYSNSGTPLRTSLALGENSLPFRMVKDQSIPIENITLPNGKPGRVGFFSFYPKTHRRRPPDFRIPPLPDPVHLSVAIPVTDERLTLRILGLTLLCTGLLMGAAVYFIVRYQVEKSYQPVKKLVNLTNTIQPDQLSLRLPCNDLPEELSPLVNQFNTLLDRLETAFVRERSFSGNIGHEIRTPLTELAALLGNAIADLEEENPEELPGEVYRDANQICEHMNRLIEVISAIHQAESGRELVSPTAFDPGETLGDVISALSSDDIEIQITDERKAGDKTITTDETLFRGILQNLVSNAVSHSEADSAIVCRLDRGKGDTLLFEISNTPQSIGPEDLARISEPFWQKDASRTERANLGLGLSLVDKYAELIQAEIGFSLKNKQFVATLVAPNLGDD